MNKPRVPAHDHRGDNQRGHRLYRLLDQLAPLIAAAPLTNLYKRKPRPCSYALGAALRAAQEIAEVEDDETTYAVLETVLDAVDAPARIPHIYDGVYMKLEREKERRAQAPKRGKTKNAA